MAPTIGKRWRGESQDYAALCDYCDVRYLRSQLQKQANGRLACFGPGTNSCSAGRDEVTLDKINADIMRDRRRPTASRGGRFDRVLASVEDIFGASLVEYWDAQKGVTSTSDGKLTSWKGQKLGATFTSDPGFGNASWHESMSQFFGRPGITIDGGPEIGALWTATGNYIPAGGRPYFAAVTFNHNDSVFYSSSNGTISFSGSGLEAAIGRSVAAGTYQSIYRSVQDPSGTELILPEDVLGSVRKARVYELDATGPVTFRAGTTETSSNIDSPTVQPWQIAILFPGMAITFLVVCLAPEPDQIDRFRTLARSYAAERQ